MLMNQNAPIRWGVLATGRIAQAFVRDLQLLPDAEVAAGTLGEIGYVTAEHGQWFAEDRSSRLFAPELGGGALLAPSSYPVSFANLVLGARQRITAVSDTAFTGVDATTSMIVQYASGAHAVRPPACARPREPRGRPRDRGAGRDRRVVLHPLDVPGDRPWRHVLERYDSPVYGRRPQPHEGHGLRHQAAEVARCLRAGLTETPLLPTDEVGRQVGLDYRLLTDPELGASR
jgi:predicted dehydrogenase